MPDEKLLPITILALTDAAGPAGSISPTDAAHAVAHAVSGAAGTDSNPDAWHQYLSAVRRAAIRLALEGRIDILRKGKPVPPEGVKGVIRLRIRRVETPRTATL